MEKEKFFICEECGELSTLTEQLHDCEQGGNGLCSCLYTAFEWSDKFNDIEHWFPRMYPDWTRIKKKWYDRLKGEKNHVLRLRMFFVIPKDKR